MSLSERPKENTPLPETPARWMSVRQAAEHLGVCDQTIRSFLHGGSLKAVRVNNSVFRIDRLDLDRFLERNKRTFAPYRRGTRPWVAERHAAKRKRKGAAR